jgi:hypothetical protein
MASTKNPARAKADEAAQKDLLELSWPQFYYGQHKQRTPFAPTARYSVAEDPGLNAGHSSCGRNSVGTALTDSSGQCDGWRNGV